MQVRRILGGNWLATAGLVLIALFVVMALAAPWLAPYNVAWQELPSRLANPSGVHWLGTDDLGRDILSRLIFGARVSMAVGGSVVFFSLLVGLVVGLVAGYYAGRLDQLLNIIVINSFLAFPGILLAIAMVAVLGPGLSKLIFALALTTWVGYARLVRGQVLKVKEMEFVLAARALGASDVRIIVRHLLPNVIQPVIVQAAVGMAGAILAESTLSFLGLGVPPPRPSWGGMLNDGRGHR